MMQVPSTTSTDLKPPAALCILYLRRPGTELLIKHRWKLLPLMNSVQHIEESNRPCDHILPFWSSNVQTLYDNTSSHIPQSLKIIGSYNTNRPFATDFWVLPALRASERDLCSPAAGAAKTTPLEFQAWPFRAAVGLFCSLKRELHLCQNDLSKRVKSLLLGFCYQRCPGRPRWRHLTSTGTYWHETQKTHKTTYNRNGNHTPPPPKQRKTYKAF